MKITIDTANDSKEEIREVLNFLKKVLGEEQIVPAQNNEGSASNENMFGSVNNISATNSLESPGQSVNDEQSSAPSSQATAAMMGMFNSQVPSNIPLNQVQEEQQSADNKKNNDDSDDDIGMGIEIVPY